MGTIKKLALGLVSAFISLSAVAQETNYEDAITTIFPSGQKETTGYHTFRIPAITMTKKGTLLAFAEGRVNGWGDAGNIDLVMRRSKDFGKTWEPIEVVFDDGNNTCRNPAPVIDTRSGRIFLVTTWSDKHEHSILHGKGRCKIFVLTSDDDGVTWSEPNEITAQVNKPEWNWYATGPGNSIQIQKGKYRGRLVVPANHSILTDEDKVLYRSHNFYSDDLGKTWKLGPVAGDGSNESTLAEAPDGRLVQNMRQQQFGKGKRSQRFSRDGGMTWDDTYHEEDLYCTVCQGSIIRDYTSEYLYYSGPGRWGRWDMTIWRSKDNGETWTKGPKIWPKRAGYSNLVSMGKGRMGILFERGEENIAEGIAFARYLIPQLFGEDAN